MATRSVDTKTYNISEFIRWHTSQELNLSPKFQRNSVWNEQAKSYLIDTILRGLPIPMIFMRQTVDVGTNRIYKEVVDGQQRLRAILDFFEGKYPIKGPYAAQDVSGKCFSELPKECKETFLEYEVATQIIKSKEDSLVYDIFARLNTNNMVLNRQELRNAKYWGLFKTFIYELGREYKGKLISWKMFTDKEFSRMKDYELLNSLVILLIDGVKSESPKIVDDYYKKYEREFKEISNVRSRFNKIIALVDKVYEQGYELNIFNRSRYFYTLFACIHKRVIENNQKIEIGGFVRNLSNIEDNIRSENPVISIKIISRIKELHYNRTTNIKERKERVSLVYDLLFNEK